MNRPASRIALWLALAAGLAVIGYWQIDTVFMGYDDEGFALISLRNYLAGLRLYDDVFSQYGPWPYVYHQLVTLGGHVALTHTFGRALTLCHWTAMALLCGGIGWRLARSQFAAVLSAVLAFGLTWQMTSEPSHPGSLISVLVALAGLVITFAPDARRPGLAYGALGALAGLLFLTKINVGLLLACGLGCFMLRFLAWPGRGQSAGWLGAAGLLALPWVLMGGQLHQPWVRLFALQFTLAAASLLWLSPPAALAERPAPRGWWAAPLGFAIALAAICGWVMARGTTLAALVETVLVGPLRMPGKFVVGLAWYAEAWPLTALSAVLALAAGWQRRRRRPLAAALVWGVLAARAAVLLCFVPGAGAWPTYAGVFHFIGDCLPLVPLFLIPLRDRPAPAELIRWGVAALALPQVLHAFPVAGSQLGWATFLCVPLLVAGWWEAAEALAERAGVTGRRAARAGAFVLAAAAALQLAVFAAAGWQRYAAARPLGLPGAENLRLNGGARQTMRLLALNASIHADILFSRQGMYSHNLWSGVPTPTTQNATHWFWLLNEAQQREIIARLQSTPRTAVITNPYLDDMLVRLQVPVTGPLQDFIRRRYRPLFDYGGFVFNVPLASTAVVFGRCELFQTGDAKLPPLLFRSNVRLDGAPASIRLETINPPWLESPELLDRHSLVIAEPIDGSGAAAGPAVRLPAPAPLRGLYRLSVYCPPLPPEFPWQSSALVVRDAGGATLSESMN